MKPSPLRYTLDPGELADAMVAHLPHARLAVRRTRFVFGACAAAFLVLAVGSPILLLPCAVTLVLVAGAPSLVRRQTVRQVAMTPAMTEPMTVTADPEGLQIDTGMSRLWYAWANYESVVTSPAGVGMIRRGGTVLRWIPARAFASDDERDAWARMAREGMAPR